jgi:hypothetical protein
MTKNEKKQKRARYDERKTKVAKQKMGDRVFWTMLILFNILAVTSIFSSPTATLNAQGVTKSEINSSQLLNASVSELPAKFMTIPFKMFAVPMKAMYSMALEFNPKPMVTMPLDIIRAMLLIEPQKRPPLSPEVEVLTANK